MFRLLFLLPLVVVALERNQVLNITSQASFEDLINSPTPVLVRFYTGKHDESEPLIKQFQTASGESKGMVKYAQVHCEAPETSAICARYKITSTTFKIFSYHPKVAPNRRITDYIGNISSASIIRECEDLVDNMLVKITGKDFQEKLRGNRFNFIYVHKGSETLPPVVIRAVVLHFYPQAKNVGFFSIKDTERSAIGLWQVTTSPAVLLQDPENSIMHQITTDLDSFSSIRDEFEEFMREKIEIDGLKEITSLKALKDEINAKRSAVVFLNTNGKSKDSKAIMKTLNMVVECSNNARHKAAFKFLWVDCASHKDFASVLNGYKIFDDQMVILNGKSKMIRLLETEISSKSLNAFFTDYFSGFTGDTYEDLGFEEL